MNKSDNSVFDKIQKTTVDKLVPQKDREVFLWDSGDGSLKGFGVRMMPSGVASYFIQYRNAHGSTRRLVVGRVGKLTPDEARELARKKFVEVANGGDPSMDRNQLRKDLTVAELVDHYLAEGPRAKPNKKASSWETDRSAFNRHVIPLLGKRIAAGLTKKDVEKFQADVAVGKTATDTKVTKEACRKHGRAIVKGGRGVAARATATLAAMLQFAVNEKVLTSNPAKGVELFQGKNRERFLSEVELVWVADTLATLEEELNPGAVAAIRSLILTGCRKEEILGLRWDYVSFEQKCLRLPDSKTGFKIVQLPAAALQLLSALPRTDKNPWVFPACHPDGKKKAVADSGHYTGLQAVWDKVRKRATVAMLASDPDTAAGELVRRLTKHDILPSYEDCVAAAKSEGWEFPVGLTNVRIHDLRHSYASFAVANGTSLFMVAKLLGHKQIRTTQKYAHLADDPVRSATDDTADKIDSIMRRGREGGRVGSVEAIK